MTEPVKRERPPTLREEYGRNQASPCWETWDSPPIVRFQNSDNPSWWIGVPFSAIIGVECIERDDGSQELSIQWKDGKMVQTIFITGPKSFELFAQFCHHQASVIKADGKDILRVGMLAPSSSE